MSLPAKAGGALTLLLLSFSPEARADTSKIARLIEADQLHAAETQLRQILSTTDDPVAYDLLGVVLGRRGSIEEAEKAFRRAIYLDPSFFSPQEHLARLYVLQQRDSQALPQLRRAASLGELDRDLAMKLGALEISQGNADRAREQFEILAERHSSVQALLYLARIEVQRGEFPSALSHLRRALPLAPNSEEVMRSYARAALDAKLPGEALSVLEPLARMHPSEFEYSYLKGVALLQAGDASAAVPAFEEAIRLGPRQALPRVALGLALNRQKRYPEAQEALLGGLRYGPDNVEGLAALAEAQLGLLDLEKAEQNALRALGRDASHAAANLVLGQVRMKQGRYEEAKDALLRSIGTDPGSPKGHYQLSLAYSRLDQPEAAQKHVELYREALKAYERYLEELGGDGLPSRGGQALE